MTGLQHKVNNMKILKIFLGLLVFLGAFAFLQSNPLVVKNACAANWGGQSVCGSGYYGSGYDVCPHSHVAPDHCVTSSDFDVTINGTGIPLGQKMEVFIAPTDGSGDACYNVPGTDVTCLDRTEDYPTPNGWDGTPMHFVFDRIGCSMTGKCTNDYTVRVRFAQPYTDPSVNCPNPADYRNSAIQNGVTNYATFTINCQAPGVTITPTPTSTCPGTCGTYNYPQGNACTTGGQNGTWQYDDQGPRIRCTDIYNPYCYICIPQPTATPTPTLPPGVTPPPTSTPIPPGVTVTPTDTPNPSCPVPDGTPVVTVTCAACNGGGTNPPLTPTPTSSTPADTPTPTIVGAPTPTVTPTQAPVAPTPTCTPNGNDNGGSNPNQCPTPTPNNLDCCVGAGYAGYCYQGTCIPDYPVP